MGKIWNTGRRHYIPLVFILLNKYGTVLPGGGVGAVRVIGNLGLALIPVPTVATH
jgi:hypothetical protein